MQGIGQTIMEMPRPAQNYQTVFKLGSDEETKVSRRQRTVVEQFRQAVRQQFAYNATVARP